MGRLLTADLGTGGAAPVQRPRSPDLPWIDARDLAVILRGVLRARFADVRFGVRVSRYSGGASIDIAWTDGPDRADVATLVEPFEGRDFDGMTDSTSYTAIRLPDGREMKSGTYIVCHRTNGAAR